MSNRFAKKYRLAGKKTIEEVFRQGTYTAFKEYKVKYLPNQKGLIRFGISISRRVGNAPFRNRIKRLIRENLRCSGILDRFSYDCLLYINVRPKENISYANAREVVENVSHHFKS